MMDIRDNSLKLDDINTYKFLHDPKSSSFEKKMVAQSEVFSLTINNVNRKKALTYITLMYDYSSTELRDRFPDVLQRKRNAAIIAGFEITNGKFSKQVQNCILNQNDTFNNAAIKYLSLSNSLDFKTYYVLTEVLDYWMKEVLKNPSQSVSDTIIKIRDKIDTIRDKLFNGEDTKDLEKALYENSASIRLALTPENIREEMEKTGLKGYSAYPDDYTPEPLRYHGDKI